MTKFEAFVSKVLSENFNQQVDAETLRATARKLEEAVDLEHAPDGRTRKEHMMAHEA